MSRRRFISLISVVLLLTMVGGASASGLALQLNRGITLDRGFTSVPPSMWPSFTTTDVKLIKSMGFGFVKITVDPGVFMSGSTINSANMPYLEAMVNQIVNEGLPVVVCIHPQPDFKNTYLGNASNFTNLLLPFYHDFAAYMAPKWNSSQLAFQLMTEPFGNYTAWNSMWPSMLSTVRTAMPNHTLIMSGDQGGIIDGLVNDVNPDLTADQNIYWSFTTYYPYIFAFQGHPLLNNTYGPYLDKVPYPSSPSIIAAQMTRILANIPTEYQSAAQTDLTAYGAANWNLDKHRAVLQPLATWRAAHPTSNPKIWCAEFGCLDRQQGNANGGGCNPADRVQFINDRRQALEEINVGWAYWSYNETFTVLNWKLRAPFNTNTLQNDISIATLVALGVRASQGASRSWDVYGDMDFEFNPNGAWSYGNGAWLEDEDNYSTPDTSALVLFNNIWYLSNSNVGDVNQSVRKWGRSDTDSACVVKHTTENDGHIYWPDPLYVDWQKVPQGQVGLDPGNPGYNYPVVARWTSPVAGKVFVHGSFGQSLSWGSPVGRWIKYNSTVKFSQLSTKAATPFDFSVTVAVGDKIDFIATQGNALYNDAIALIARIDFRTCADLATQGSYLQYDYNHDCRVNFADFAVFAQGWLATCNDPQNPACTYMP